MYVFKYEMPKGKMHISFKPCLFAVAVLEFLQDVCHVTSVFMVI